MKTDRDPLIPQEVLEVFGLSGAECSVLKGGHINGSYALSGPQGHFVLQRLNRYVFPQPELVMENFSAVTEHLRGRLAALGRDPNRETLSLRRTLDGQDFCRDSQGEVWRCTLFLDDTVAHESAAGMAMLREAGRAFGEFQGLLADFPARRLHTILPGFHDTRLRVRQLRQALAEDRAGRADSVREELDFAFARADTAGRLMELLEAGSLPLRVTHNDTKLSNILFDRQDRAVCVIDLDTVMPGLTAFDFGDSIRAGASTAAEDEPELSKVRFDPLAFAAYTEGFLSAAGHALTTEELRTLPDGAILMTYEVGTRFLADYLNGDVYFHVAYPEHNLVRCRNQFRLAADMEKNRNEMDKVIRRSSRAQG